MRAFLRAHIPSIGHMEALALTVENATQSWTVEHVARRLYVPEAQAETLIRHLSATGLLERTGTPEQWRFAPADETLAGLATRTVRLYRQRLLRMTELIRAGADPGSQLADAFRFRKE
ncbi:MAG: hypothetical protein V4850_26150 [Myxococcota bacterium]